MNRPHTDETWTRRTWDQIESAIHETGMADPPAGFSTRFWARMSAQRSHESRRNALLVASIWLTLALILFLLLLWAIAPLFVSPLALFLDLIRWGISVVTSLSTVIAVALSLFQFFPELLPGSVAYWGLLALLGTAAWGYGMIREYALAQGVRL